MRAEAPPRCSPRSERSRARLPHRLARSATCAPTSARCANRSHVTESIRADMDALNLPTKLLNGEEVVDAAVGRFNPTRRRHAPPRPAPAHRDPRPARPRRSTLEEARRAARRLRASIAQSSADFRRSKHHAEIERDAVQTIYAQTTADATHMGWLLSCDDDPPAVHAERVRPRARPSARAPAAEARLPAPLLRQPRRRVARAGPRLRPLRPGARGRTASSQRWPATSGPSIFRVSIYQSIRARGPEPDLEALAEAVDYCAERIEIAIATARSRAAPSNRRSSWQTSLPLGRDVAARTRRTRRATSATPCRSSAPAAEARPGFPFAFSDPGPDARAASTHSTARTPTTHCHRRHAPARARRPPRTSSPRGCSRTAPAASSWTAPATT